MPREIIEEGLHGDVNWSKVSSAHLSRYEAFVNAVFDLIDEGKIRARVMFTENSLVPEGLTEYHREHSSASFRRSAAWTPSSTMASRS